MEEGGCPMTPWGVTVVLAQNCPAGRSFGNSDGVNNQDYYECKDTTG